MARVGTTADEFFDDTGDRQQLLALARELVAASNAQDGDDEELLGLSAASDRRNAVGGVVLRRVHGAQRSDGPRQRPQETFPHWHGLSRVGADARLESTKLGLVWSVWVFAYYRGLSKAQAEAKRLGEPSKPKSFTPAPPKGKAQAEVTPPAPVSLDEEFVNYAEQAFPDSYRFIYTHVDDGYKQVGNAVPIGLARAVGETCLQMLSEAGGRGQC